MKRDFLNKKESIYKEKDAILLPIIYDIQNGHDEQLEKVILMSEGTINGVFKKINKMSRFELRKHYEDMMQEGRMAVINAVMTYDKKRGTSPSTHIFNKCYSQMTKYVRGMFKGDKSDLRMDDEHIESLESGATNILEKMVIEESVLKMLDNISKKEREVLIYKFWWELKNSEIASIMNVSMSTMKKRFRTSKKKLINKFPEFKDRGDKT